MVYTPEAPICRQSFGHDLALLPKEQRLAVPVVSSAAPMAGHNLSFPDERIKRPRCTHDILRSWMVLRYIHIYHIYIIFKVIYICTCLHT